MRTSFVVVSMFALSGLAACAKPPPAQTPIASAAADTPAAPASSGAEPAPDDLSTPADVAAPPAGATKTASGLAYKVLRPGTGAQHPTMSDTVRVHYSGWMTDGTMFDSSVARNKPASFPVSGVIKGWSEGVQLMVVGEKARFWIPAGLAYGDTKQGSKPYGMLVFDVELLAIE